MSGQTIFKTMAELAASALLLAGGILTYLTLRKKDRLEKLRPLAVPQSGKPRILIVDDDPNELDQIRLTLNGDYDLVLCRRPYKAIAEIAMEYDRGNAFSLIILDCMMRPMIGERIVQVVRLMEMEGEIRSPIAYFTRMGRLVKKPASVSAVWRKPEDHLTLAKKVREIIAGT